MTLPVLLHRKAPRRRQTSAMLLAEHPKTVPVFGGRVMTLPYGVFQQRRNAAIRSTHCFAAVPDSVEPSSAWWRAVSAR